MRSYFFIYCIMIPLTLLLACNESSPTPKKKVLNIRVEALDYSIQGSMKGLSLKEYGYSNFKAMFSPRGTRLGGKTSGIPDNSPHKITKLGTHLHLNIDNQLHFLSNRNVFEAPIKDGVHKLFAFVCGSNYSSIKTPDAQLCKLVELRNGQLIKSNDLEQAFLIYNAPLMENMYMENQKIILDFVLFNCQIAPNQNYVALSINEQKITQLHQWQAYQLIGLPRGSYRIKLELYDANDKLLAPPVEQQIRVQASTQD